MHNEHLCTPGSFLTGVAKSNKPQFLTCGTHRGNCFSLLVKLFDTSDTEL